MVNNGEYFIKEIKKNKINRVGIMINKNAAKNVNQQAVIFEEIISITLKVNRRYKSKIVQVYTPITEHVDEEIEEFYEEIKRAVIQNPSKYITIMRIFYAKVREPMNGNNNEKLIGQCSMGARNDRGQRLVH